MVLVNNLAGWSTAARVCPQTGEMRYAITKIGLAIRIPEGATSAEMKELVRAYKKREKLMKPRAPIQPVLFRELRVLAKPAENARFRRHIRIFADLSEIADDSS